MWQRQQFRQTIIGTGAVGAIIGTFVVLGLFAFRSEYGQASVQGRPLILQALDLAFVLVFSVGFCVAVFGLLPMALQYAFAWLVRRSTVRI